MRLSASSWAYMAAGSSDNKQSEKSTLCQKWQRVLSKLISGENDDVDFVPAQGEYIACAQGSEGSVVYAGIHNFAFLAVAAELSALVIN